MTKTIIFCCGCGCDVEAVLVTGAEIYPHRKDLAELPFWRCPTCQNYVGCHHKTADRTRPLGNIPTQELRDIRQRIHRILDPLWETGMWQRTTLYSHLSKLIGRRYHTAELRTIEEATKVYKELVAMKKGNAKRSA